MFIVRLHQTYRYKIIDYLYYQPNLFNRPNCGGNLRTVPYQFLTCTRHTRFRETLKIAIPRKTRVTRLVYFCSCISSYLTLFMQFSIRFSAKFSSKPSFYHVARRLLCCYLHASKILTVARGIFVFVRYLEETRIHSDHEVYICNFLSFFFPISQMDTTDKSLATNLIYYLSRNK